MITTDTVTDCTTNDLSTTTPTQNSFDGIKPPLGYQITEVLKLCSSTNAKKISALTKEACTALGLPLDTKGGNKPPEQNIAIFNWLRDNKTTSAELTDLPTVEVVEPIEPVEVLPVPEVITTSTTTDLFDIDTTLETVTPSNQMRQVSYLNNSMQVVINADVILDIKATHALALNFRNVSKMHGRRVGELLLQVKAELNHGEFGEWLAENVGVSIRQAQRYMNDAKGLPPKLRTVEIRQVSHLNPPADLVTQVETIETESLRLENEKLQNELLKAQQAADELRNNQTQIIDAKVSAAISTEQAALVVESSAAMQALQKQLSDAQDKIAQQKKDYDKDVKDGVARGLGAKECEIQRLEYKKEIYERDIEGLKQTRDGLDKEVGAVQRHQELIKQIKDNLASVGIDLWDVLDSYPNSTPVEVLHDWHLIEEAVDKIKQDVSQIISNGRTLREVIKSQPIDGEVVTL